MSKSAYFVLVVLFVVPLAKAQTIFKCVGKNGPDRYQNFPCPPESQSKVLVRDPGPGHTNVQPLPSASREPPPSRDERRVEAPALPVAATAAAPEEPPALQGELRAGMTAKEVRATWGQPAEILDEEVVEGRVQTWSYPGSRALQFDAGGRLSGVPR